MKIEFVGGTRTVTGSSFIIKDDDFTIMVDCGMFQGKRELKERNSLHLIYSPPKIDALLLTHAHIDHSGLIPKLVKEGFYGNIYATKATVDLARIMLPDSAHIQEMDAELTNRKNKKLGRELTEPLYTSEDAEDCLKNFVPLSYGKKVKIHPRVEVRFIDAGHILGSAIIEVWVYEGDKKTKIVFTGDLGPGGQALIRDPEIVDEADYLVIESTYGNRLHKNKDATNEELKEILEDAINSGGNIIIPAFAVERTQEIIYTLSKFFNANNIPKIPVYIDSPLAISATEIFRKNSDCFDDETKKILMSGENPLDYPNLHFTKTTAESKKLNETAKGSIIISASGMCTAGRIKFHLLNNLFKPESNIIFVGFQAEGTLGRRLIDGAKQVRILGEDVIVKAKMHTLGGFSGHADQKGLLDWISNIKNEDLKIFVVHGEESSSLAFADEIRNTLGLPAYVPQWGEIVNLKTMKPETAGYDITEIITDVDREIENLNETIADLKKRYSSARDKKSIPDITKLQDDLNDVNEYLSVIIEELKN